MEKSNLNVNIYQKIEDMNNLLKKYEFVKKGKNNFKKIFQNTWLLHEFDSLR